MIALSLKRVPAVPLEAEVITPDALAGLPLSEIAALPIVEGNARAPLGDFFAMQGEPGDEVIRIEGDCSRVKYIGKGMTKGRIEVRGDVGMHVGAEMRGGEIAVYGNAGDWAGAEMRGGLLRVEGRAGDLLGAGYRGSERGMRGGAILVRGAAGDEIGRAMRRGLIAVGGDAGEFTGAAMLAGSIFVLGRLGGRPGIAMKRGTIIAARAEGEPPALLPTFRFDCIYRPAWIELYLQALRQWRFAIPDALRSGRYRRYSGDLLELGKGEILTWTTA
jgi:formylmethanofuran dehydrogenase subunit C